MTMIRRRGLCLVLSAPSGAGKTAIAQALLADEPALRSSVSVTTRAPRAGEVEGVHYHFITETRFEQMQREDALLEWARVLHGTHGYGTPRAPVEKALAEGADVIFDIDWQGHQALRRALPGDVVSVFVLPPSLAALEQRLRKRAVDQEAEIARRMAVARAEIAHWAEFDHVVLNEELDQAIATVRAILHAARCTTQRQPGLAAFVAGLG